MSDSNSKNLQNAIREVSLSRLRTYSRVNGLSIENIPVQPMVFAHWMTVIMVSGQNLTFVFKAHFMHEHARFLAANAFHLEPDAVKSKQSIDFFCEYCNLVGGGVSQLLSENDITVGISLPVWSRGFDEVFFIPPRGALLDCWKLRTPTFEVYCSSQLEILKSFEYDGIKLDQNVDSGAVEFL